MSERFEKYTKIPFKHLGDNPETGLDCFNLNRYILKEELGIDIGYESKDVNPYTDNNWYNLTNRNIMLEGFTNPKWGWVKVSSPKEFDVILMYIGATNVANHCALYIGKNKILQIRERHLSSISPYGDYYQQYTIGIYRWHTLV